MINTNLLGITQSGQSKVDYSTGYTGGIIGDFRAGISRTVNTNNFKIVNSDFIIGAGGKSWKLEDLLTLSTKARFMREGHEIALPKPIWDALELFMVGDNDGYSDLMPHEFIDKIMSKEPTEQNP